MKYNTTIVVADSQRDDIQDHLYDVKTQFLTEILTIDQILKQNRKSHL